MSTVIIHVKTRVCVIFSDFAKKNYFFSAFRVLSKFFPFVTVWQTLLRTNPFIHGYFITSGKFFQILCIDRLVRQDLVVYSSRLFNSTVFHVNEYRTYRQNQAKYLVKISVCQGKKENLSRKRTRALFQNIWKVYTVIITFSFLSGQACSHSKFLDSICLLLFKKLILFMSIISPVIKSWFFINSQSLQEQTMSGRQHN